MLKKEMLIVHEDKRDIYSESRRQEGHIYSEFFLNLFLNIYSTSLINCKQIQLLIKTVKMLIMLQVANVYCLLSTQHVFGVTGVNKANVTAT